jgi:acyl carrier protein
METMREQVLNDVLTVMRRMAHDWEFEGEIGRDTRLFGDLGFESLDVVVLATSAQEQYGQPFPFPELFAELGRGNQKDISVGEWVDFICTHLKRDLTGATEQRA